MTCATNRDAVLRTERLCVHYGPRPALLEVTAAFHRGCITALVGPSGCGKTSFLNCLNRMSDLVAGCRVSGGVYLDGQDIRNGAVNIVSLRRQVGMIFQSPNPFPKSVRANLQLALKEHGIRGRDELESITERSLRAVGLWNEVKDLLDQSALSLSGGQQQRLCIARAIALQPKVLLMDEPCSALDPMAAGVVEDLITELGRQYTILIVTHNLAQARRVADETAVFWVRDGSGRLIEQGPTQQVFSQPGEEETKAYVTGRQG